MEFWGVEVKAGETLKVVPDFMKLIHISQAALGEVKKGGGADLVPIRLKINDQNFVLGTLSASARPQLTFDLVFEKEFELSHDWKNGSVYFCGYKADDQDEGDYDIGSEDSGEEDGLDIPETGKLSSKAGEAEPTKLNGELKAEADNSGSSDDEDMSNSGDSEDENDSDSEGDSEDSEASDEPTLKEVKRPLNNASKAPVPAKKGKFDTPQKTGGNKNKAAGPIPSKQSGNNKSKQQSPKINNKPKQQSGKKGKHGGK